MLTTQTPWAGIEPAAVHIRIAFEQPLLPIDGISPQLRTALELMLCRELEERPSTEELLKMVPFNGGVDGEAQK